MHGDELTKLTGIQKVGSSLNLISSASVRKTPKLGRKVRLARPATEFSSFQGVCRKVMLLLFKFLPLIKFLIKVFVGIQCLMLMRGIEKSFYTSP